MTPASHPRPRTDVRVVVAELGAAPRVTADVTRSFREGDVVVVNDAATLPAALAGRTAAGEPIEARLASAIGGSGLFRVVLFGAGDHRIRTEDRPPHPPVAAGEQLTFGDLVVDVVRLASPLAIVRILDWEALYRAGRPVQYAHVPAPLALWDVQNAWAGAPWAVEMPSAGRVFDLETLLTLRRRGVAVAPLTHAAGLSSLGARTLDVLLPFPEHYRIPDATARAVGEARARGGRVIAVGTSVVRALEGAARARTNEGITSLRLGTGSRRRVVDAVVTGVHDAGTSHDSLLHAFLPAAEVSAIRALAETEGLLGHELGDACLVIAPLARGRDSVARGATVAAL